MSMANLGGLASGTASGLSAGQTFNNNQQLQPLLQQHQQLQNRMLEQRLAGAKAGTGFNDTIGAEGIKDVSAYMQGNGQGSSGQGDPMQGDPMQGQGQRANSAWNSLVDPLGIIQQLGLPMPQDPTTFLQALNLPGLAFGGQPQQGGSGAYLPNMQGTSYGTPSANYAQGFQPSPMNYWGIGGQ
jgi:hypothetical protein